MFRFFVNKKEQNSFPLPKETLNHIKVARVEKENFICTYEGKFYECKLVGNSAEIIKEINEDHEFKNEVILAASIIDTKRFEWLIQKAAELGATKIIPMTSKNVSKKISGEIERKIERWNEIALNASEQSFRNYPLVVTNITSFEDVLKNYNHIPNKFIAHEKKDAQVKHNFNSNVLFLTGPEGGFSEDEVQNALKQGFEVLSLGKRILRAETASIFMLSRIND